MRAERVRRPCDADSAAELTTGGLGRALADDPDLGLLDSERYEGVIGQITRAGAHEAAPGASGGSVS